MDLSTRARERRAYLVGAALALALTLAAFATVASGLFARTTAIVVVGALAALQMAVHLRWFLHLDLSESRREDLQLVLFAALLILLMTGGTLWIMLDLHGRMGGAHG